MMKIMPFAGGFLLLVLAFAACSAGLPSIKNQASSSLVVADRQVGGPCDGCELMLEGMPEPEALGSALQLSPAGEPVDALEIEGIAMQVDGKRPAAGVVFYVYHPDATGRYIPGNGQTQAVRHGHLRGWVRSDAQGRFRIRSIRPAPRPRKTIPAHIHLCVKEPGMTPYYVDEVRFDDDSLQTAEETSQAEGRGGDLLLHLSREAAGTWLGNLTIYCGRNIPDYPSVNPSPR